MATIEERVKELEELLEDKDILVSELRFRLETLARQSNLAYLWAVEQLPPEEIRGYWGKQLYKLDKMLDQAHGELKMYRKQEIPRFDHTLDPE